MLRILSEHKPGKVFVFTTKGWDAFPLTDQERAGGRCTPLIDGLRNPSWGDYTFDDHRVRACGFRHPQLATAALMKEQVQAFLNVKD